MTEPALGPVPIPPVNDKSPNVLALGCWAFGGKQWGGQDDDKSREAMEAALRVGMNHFDTAQGYGAGRSEELVGAFLEGRRDQVFLATKLNTGNPDFDDVISKIDTSLHRLRTDYIDLFYIHWPPVDEKLAPLMESLEKARDMGKIRAIGVSNFSVDQMEIASKGGHIDAHQIGYNLLWRFDEADVMPWCREHGVALVTYSSIAQGVLTGKFPRHPEFPEGDQRPKTVIFQEDVWPHVYEAVEQLKQLAEEAARPMAHLAIQWVARQEGVASVLVGARDGAQVQRNAGAMQGGVPDSIFDRMTEISDAVTAKIPNKGNIFDYHPKR